MVKKSVNNKLTITADKLRVIKKTPKIEKEKISNKTPAPTAHHKAKFKPPNPKIKIKTTRIKLKLFKYHGKAEMKEIWKAVNIKINTMLITILYVFISY